jgi:hypothetical protein
MVKARAAGEPLSPAPAPDTAPLEAADVLPPLVTALSLSEETATAGSCSSSGSALAVMLGWTVLSPRLDLL